MKRTVSLIACILLLCSVVLSVVACGPNEAVDELVVYNWADYIYDYEDAFKAHYKAVTGRDIEVTYVTFDTNETMLARLTQGDSNVDVVCPSEYAIQKMIELDMLQPLYYFDEASYTKGMNIANPAEYTHNSGNVEGQILSMVGEAFTEFSMADYFVPYMYGTLGLLYNKYAFEKYGITPEMMNDANWGILFNDNGLGGGIGSLSKELKGSILMKDSIRDSYAATIFYLLESGRLDGLTNPDGELYTEMSIGQLINEVDDQLLELCEEVLVAQKSQLFGYEVDFGKDDLLQGNAIVDLAWSGDALYAVEESWSDDLGEDGDYELAYYVPHGAGNIWFDGWVMPKNCKNPTAAKLFINFLNSPQSAAANILEIGYTSAVDPEVLRESTAAKEVLCRGYLVYAPEYWDLTIKEKKTTKVLTEDDCDFASWEEFEEYFFDNFDNFEGTNWRYPFMANPNPV